MPSIYRDTYVPILLTRQAEIRSLGDLSSQIANSIVPMFMVHPRDWDYDNDDYKRSVDDHLDRLVKDLSSRWGDREALVDVGHVDERLREALDHPREVGERPPGSRNLGGHEQRGERAVSGGGVVEVDDMRVAVLSIRKPFAESSPADQSSSCVCLPASGKP